MNSRRRHALLVCVALAEMCAAAQAKPNQAQDELKFETSDVLRDWVVRGEETEKGKTTYYHDPGPVKPTHVAEVVLSREYWPFRAERDILERIEESPIGQKLSQAQREFLRTGFGIWIDGETRRIPKRYSIWIYAVSENDAKTSVHAFLDTCAKRIEQYWQKTKQHLSRDQQELEQAKKDLPEKETELKKIEQEYKRAKGRSHPVSSDEEAAELARKTILEMDKMLDTLQIELAGIREKLKVIKNFREEPDLSTDIRGRLDQMFVEQTIELSGLEARREMADRIRTVQQHFYRLFTERKTLGDEIFQLRKSVRDKERYVQSISDLLKNPDPGRLPPKVYQDKVTIYEVRTDQ